MGQAVRVHMDRDGRSLWMFDRWGNVDCVGSKLDPIGKFDPSGKHQRVWNATEEVMGLRFSGQVLPTRGGATSSPAGSSFHPSALGSSGVADRFPWV
jgi:hypothetical protein